jgi:hypothetical protein
MPRPKLAEGQKLIPATVCLPSSAFDALSREAHRREVSLAKVLRERIESTISRTQNPPRDAMV